ncbi:MAG: hypothetical protein IAC55_07365 [Tyzzerella sp.]|uniref:Uncharacterized protein n=1 Tax=Candidatus Fimicola merdigallinarum TaxID=2840819 RepID=A0A9D9DY18_9FIRM|nr:hypothetical protein [Candidatus Fimicola merdigallinarum]
MAKDNELFNKIIIEKILECEKVIGEKDAKLLQNIEKFGGVEACRNVLKRRQYSKCFNKLKDKGRLDLSMEAVVVDSRFSKLFDDDEVNFCFETLCDNGYFN